MLRYVNEILYFTLKGGDTMSEVKVTVHVNENVTETLKNIKIGQLYDILKSHSK